MRQWTTWLWVLFALISTTVCGLVAQRLSVLYCECKRLGVRICKITNVFLHQIKLNWHGWSPRRVHEHSMSSLSSTAHGLHGLHVECSWSPWEGVGECKVLIQPVPDPFDSYGQPQAEGQIYGVIAQCCPFLPNLALHIMPPAPIFIYSFERSTMQECAAKTLRVITIPHWHLMNSVLNWVPVTPGCSSESSRSRRSRTAGHLVERVGAGITGILISVAGS